MTYNVSGGTLNLAQSINLDEESFQYWHTVKLLINARSQINSRGFDVRVLINASLQ